MDVLNLCRREAVAIRLGMPFVFLFLSRFQIPVVSFNITCTGSVMESILHSVDLQLRLSGGLNEYFRLSCPSACTLVHYHKSVLLDCSFFPPLRSLY